MQPWLVKDMDTSTFQRPIDWNYVFNSEKSVSNGVISVEHRRRRHRHRHGGIRNNGKHLNTGNKKNGRTSNGGRSDEYSRFEPLPLLRESCTFVVFCLKKIRLHTSVNVVHATVGEDRTPFQTQHTRIFFLLRAV